MKNKFRYSVKEFSSFADQALLKEILALNQDNTPEVGNLASIKELQNLARQSSNNYYISSKDEIIAFMICFREKSDYHSENYKFFSKKEKKFLYVDRIAIKDTYRRKGIAKNLYSMIEIQANAESIPLCCEVNTIPLNDISIKFHEDFGFLQVGKHDFIDHSVAYFQK